MNKYWMKRTYNTFTGVPVVKVYTNGLRAPLQIIQFEVIDDDWEASEKKAEDWMRKN